MLQLTFFHLFYDPYERGVPNPSQFNMKWNLLSSQKIKKCPLRVLSCSLLLSNKNQRPIILKTLIFLP